MIWRTSLDGRRGASTDKMRTGTPQRSWTSLRTIRAAEAQGSNETPSVHDEPKRDTTDQAD